MISLEILRLEMNYLKQVIEDVIGCKASEEIVEAIEILILYFLNPKNYDTFCLSNLQTIEQYLNQIQQEVELYKYKLLLNNISTIIIFMEKVKTEIPKC
ncbi:hypothetical protein EV204_101313 [Tissierella praeacuta]|uniref:hypothetical protein n=1 Tax=Tissierella praeacuta TaxID=43131 RepID=UPI001043C7EE|nr:hypothetical protein [Tissierella praeacuta]TCU79334.1 hypothetical protein EV204_101313 [Tissierella praeacuta]